MNQTIKSLIYVSIIGAVVAVGCSESTEQKMEEKTDSIASKIDQGMDNLGNRVDSMNIGKRDDKDFLEDAVEANTDEIRVLMIGQQKGGKDVKAHVSHMLKDHKAMGEEAKAYMAKKNITLTDVDTADHDDDDFADRKAGADFDKAFADKMVSDHEKVVRMFEDELDDVEDADLKAWIEKTIPKLKSHLEMSRELQNKLNGTK